MSEKTVYTPGDVASFLSKQSDGKTTSKEESQLRALFENQPRVKSSPKRKIQKEPTKSNALQENKKSVSKEVAHALEVASRLKALQKGNSTVETSSERKSRKRSASEHDEVSLRESKKPAKQLKEHVSDAEELPEEQEERKLSGNEKNAQRRVNLKQKKGFSKESDSKNPRTVFVGNVALTVTKKVLKKLFKQFGQVEAVRIRSVPVAAQTKDGKDLEDDPSNTTPGQKKSKRKNSNKNDDDDEDEKEPGKPKKLPRRALVIMKEFDPQRHSMNAYVVFETEEAAQESLKLNGTELEGLHIRVDMASTTKKHDHKSSIFVGNLPFDVEEEAVRKHFDVCGAIENIRIVRNKYTGVGKGFGYVKFENMSSVKLALSLDGQLLLDRPLRVKKAAKKPKKKKVPTATLR